MSRGEYVQYLRDQSRALNYVADELERGDKPLSEWMVDWTLKRDRELIDAEQEYHAELEKAAERGVA